MASSSEVETAALCTYARDAHHWRKYQQFFPEYCRVMDETAPTETLWTMRPGLNIHLDRYHVDKPNVKVICLHGGGGNGRLLGPFAVAARSAGAAAVCPDLPGYGLTECAAKDALYSVWVEVVGALIEYEHERDPTVPIILLGASLGGMLAYHGACVAPAGVVKCVIATTLADPRLQQVRDEFSRHWILGRVGSPLLAFLSKIRVLWRTKLPIKLVSRMSSIANDPLLSALIEGDPHGGGRWVSIAFLDSLMAMTPAIEPENFTVCPVLLAHPGDDRWTTLSSSMPFYDRLDKTKVAKMLVVLENCGHVPIEEPGVGQFTKAVGDVLTRVGQRKPALEST